MKTEPIEDKDIKIETFGPQEDSDEECKGFSPAQTIIYNENEFEFEGDEILTSEIKIEETQYQDSNDVSAQVSKDVQQFEKSQPNKDFDDMFKGFSPVPIRKTFDGHENEFEMFPESSKNIQRIEESRQNVTQPNDDFKIAECKECFVLLDRLQDNYQRVNFKTENSVIEKKPSIQHPGEGGLITCEICRKHFRHEKLLAEHQIKHRTFVCYLCKFAAADSLTSLRKAFWRNY